MVVELTGGLVLLCLVVLTHILRRHRALVRNRRRLLEIVGELPLRVESSGFKAARGAGELRGAPLSVEVVEDGARGLLRVRMAGLDPDLRLEKFYAPSRLAPILTGDPTFDGAVLASGDRATALARLDGRTRALARRSLTFWPMEAISGGRLVIYLELKRAPEWVREELEVVAELGARLAAGRFDAPLARERALLRNAQEDPDREVRVTNLDCLIRGCEDPELLERVLALAAAVGDPRLHLAAVAIGRAAADPARLLAVVGNPEWPGAQRREALLALPGEIDEELLTRAAIAGLRGQEPAVLPEALRLAACCPLGAPGLEEALLYCLEAALVPGGALRFAAPALKALSETGTASAVAPLQEHLQRLSPFGRQARAIRSAVRAIQARLVDTGAGAFALSEAPVIEQGALSIAVEPGALAVVPESA